ncbi:MAG: MBOAT family O-acyltransferase [Actinomycetota bacterium]
MLFTQPIFFAFLAVVLALQWVVLPRNQARKVMLLLASYVFYAAWDVRFLSLIILSTLVDHVAATRIAAADDPGTRRRWLLLSLVVNLGMLGIFKYLGFFADSLQDLIGAFGGEVSDVTLNITLPVGISFFTFQTLSYTIDVYRGSLEPRKSLLDVAVFVAFFPQLVAGPIVRASHFLPQLDTTRRLADVAWRPALTLFLVGFFKKAVVADTIGAEVDKLFADPAAFGWLATVGGVLGYAVQIYGDFSGYSDMAIATAMMLGYSLGENFNFPYFSRSIDDFWRRWHISLSSWLRDYLYIPLGGNRGSELATYRNLLLTMLLGGLWHGAAWTFVAWGALHGGALALHRWWTRGLGRRAGDSPVANAAAIAGTFVFVVLVWIPFRAVTFGDMTQVLTNLVGLGDGAQGLSPWLAVYLAGAAVLHALAYQGRAAKLPDTLPAPQYAAVLGVAAALALALRPLGSSPFIYFQF